MSILPLKEDKKINRQTKETEIGQTKLAAEADKNRRRHIKKRKKKRNS